MEKLVLGQVMNTNYNPFTMCFHCGKTAIPNFTYNRVSVCEDHVPKELLDAEAYVPYPYEDVDAEFGDVERFERIKKDAGSEQV